jgi:hypothetical protein
MQKDLVVIALAALLPWTLHAQADTVRTGSIVGTVYDSVARAPLAGAVVEIVRASNPSAGMRSVVTDNRGRYEIAGIDSGRYIAGFRHDALDSLELDLSPRSVDVIPGRHARLDFAVPAPSTIVTAVCGPRWVADSTGLLFGLLRDARTRSPLDTGTVQVRWQELVFSQGGIHYDDKLVTRTVDRNGWYALCEVPGGVDVVIRAWEGADSTGPALATVAVGGIARRDFFLRGTATIRGFVLSERKRPVPNARVGIAGRERSVITDSAGNFFLGDIHAGSQTLEFRALGFAPEYRFLHLPDRGDTTLAVTVTSTRKVLDTIRVVGRRILDRDLEDFRRRRRMGSGSYLDEEEIRRRRPSDVFQLLWGLPGVRISQHGLGRTVLMSGMAGLCAPDFFLNGWRMSSDLLGELDLLARLDEVIAIEVYRGGQAPAEFATLSMCGSIVIWTRIGPRLPR